MTDIEKKLGLLGQALSRGGAWEGELYCHLVLRSVIPKSSRQMQDQARALLARFWNRQGHGQAASILMQGDNPAGPNYTNAFLLRNLGRQVELCRSQNPMTAERHLELARLYTLMGALEPALGHCRQAQKDPALGEQALLTQELAGIWQYAPGSVLRGGPSGPHWQASLEALQKADSALAAMLARPGAHGGFMGFALPGGLIQLMEPDGAWLNHNYAWWPELAKMRLKGNSLADSKRPDLSCLINGLHGGMELELLFQATTPEALRPMAPLLVMEKRPQILAWLLGCRPWARMIESGRVFFLAGPEAPRSLVELLLARPGLKRPNWLYPPRGREAERNGFDPRFLNDLNQDLARFQTHWEGRAKAVLAAYAKRTRGEWSRVWSADGGARPRILFLATRFAAFSSHCIRDMAMACGEMGLPSHTLIEPDLISNIEISQMVQALEFQPDLCITINVPGSRMSLRPKGLPFVTWVQDEWSPLARVDPRELPVDDFVVGINYNQSNYTNLHPKYLMIPNLYTNCTLYRPLPLTPDEQKRYGAQISFVSHRSQSPQRAGQELLAGLKAKHGAGCEQARLAALALQRLKAFYQGESRIWHLRQIGELAGEPWAHSPLSREEKTQLASSIFYNVNEIYYREQMLLWACRLGLDLKLWGRGWEQHPRLKQYACGVAQNGEELCKIYNASQINLHAACTTNLHQRILDAAASGAFFMMPHHPASDERMAFISTMADIVEKEDRNTARDFLAAGGRDLFRHQKLDILDYFRKSHLSDTLTAHYRLYSHSFNDQKKKLADEENIENLLPWLADITFKDQADLAQKIRYFLERPQQRAQYGGRARESVCARLNYQVLMQKIINFVAEYYQKALAR